MNLLPVELFRAEQVREMDRRAIQDHSIPGFTLMARAAKAALTELRWRWPDAASVTVVCGPGNNGGDGLLLAALARKAGMNIRVMLAADPQHMTDDAKRACDTYRQVGGVVEPFQAKNLPASGVIVDALIGTGLSRKVEGVLKSMIEHVRRAHEGGVRVLSIDIPSGLDADRGAVLGVAVRADVTVTFIGLKLGLFVGEGRQYAGRVVFSNLEVPPAVYDGIKPAALRIPDRDRAALLVQRKRTSHKTEHGHVLLVGGDLGMAGAIRLAAEASLRSGAGLVSVATRKEHAGEMTQARPELMCRGVEDPEQLDPLLQRASVVAVGPGLGRSAWGRSMWAKVRLCGLPMVVDADALNLLAGKSTPTGKWVLTPHPGEAARLLQTTNAVIQADRTAAVAAIAERYGGVAVLKGAGTLVQAASGPPHICTAGNPGMAAGGMGDLLCGVIAGLLAQRLEPLDAARIGVHVHARAGDLAAQASGERGLLPSDLLPYIRQLVNP